MFQRVFGLVAVVGLALSCEHSADTASTGVSASGGVDALRAHFTGAPTLLRAGTQSIDYVDGRWTSRVTNIEIRLPSVATGWVHLREARGLEARFSLVGASGSAAVLDEGVLRFDGAYQGGAMLLRVDADGVEDVVEVQSGDHLDYQIDVSQVAGLRQVGGTLELLDADGAPRLRVLQPYLVDSVGTRRDATLSIEDCAVSHDPRPPWRTAITQPGSDTCTMRVSWDDSELAYPVLVDPQWVSSASMAASRAFHSLTWLNSQEMLVAGGSYTVPQCVPFTSICSITWKHRSSAEVYNASLDSWATVPNMPAARTRDASALLPSGKAMLVGGAVDPSLIYDPNTPAGPWSPGPAMPGGAPGRATATVLADGRVLVVGRPSGALIFDEGNATPWIDVNDPAAALVRGAHTATLVGDKVLIAGGVFVGQIEATKYAALFDTVNETWSVIPDMQEARAVHAAIAVNGGVVVTGGKGCDDDLNGGLACPMMAGAELYDVQAGTWSAQPAMGYPRAYHSLSTLSNGWILAVGGSPCFLPHNCDTNWIPELFDPQSGGWFNTISENPGDPNFASPGAWTSAHQATTLPSGDTTMVGGVKCATSLNVHQCQTRKSVTSYRLGVDGDACTVAGECASGNCVDGVCCDQPCAGACSACTAALKGAGVDGSCGSVPDGSADPRQICTLEGAASCGMIGTCGFGGTCAVYGAGVSCMAPTCIGDTLTTGACDGLGSCVPASVSCAPDGCDTDVCGAGCVVDDDCADSAFCSANVCVPALELGQPCAGKNQCASEHCTDGVCCDVACDRQCEACAVVGAEGTCAPISGTPAAGRPTCDQRDATDPCSQTICDGVVRDSCAGYAGGDVSCGDASCTADVLTKATFCDGSGACPVPETQDCEPYACATDACLDACSDTTDCAPGSVCDGGICASPATCQGSTLIESDGSAIDCSPYLCVDGGCATSCAYSTDCGERYVCDAEGRCVIPPDASARVEGCSCHIVGEFSGRTPWRALWGLLLGSVWLARRKMSL